MRCENVLRNSKEAANADLLVPRPTRLHGSTLTSRGTALRAETSRQDILSERDTWLVSLCECTTRSRSYFFRFPLKSSLSPSSPSASLWLSFASLAVVSRRRTRRYSGFRIVLLRLPLVSTLLFYILSRRMSRRCFSHRM